MVIYDDSTVEAVVKALKEVNRVIKQAYALNVLQHEVKDAQKQLDKALTAMAATIS